jgi:hypothetical protein
MGLELMGMPEDLPLAAGTSMSFNAGVGALARGRGPHAPSAAPRETLWRAIITDRLSDRTVNWRFATRYNPRPAWSVHQAVHPNI